MWTSSRYFFICMCFIDIYIYQSVCLNYFPLKRYYLKDRSNWHISTLSWEPSDTPVGRYNIIIFLLLARYTNIIHISFQEHIGRGRRKRGGESPHFGQLGCVSYLYCIISFEEGPDIGIVILQFRPDIIEKLTHSKLKFLPPYANYQSNEYNRGRWSYLPTSFTPKSPISIYLENTRLIYKYLVILRQSCKLT